MAKALVSHIETASPGTPAGRVTIDYVVFYVGADVAGGLDRDIVQVANLDLSVQPSQIDAAIGAAVKTRAASLGINVGNNEVIIEGKVKA